MSFELIADYVPDSSGRYRIFRDGDIHVTVWGDGAIFDPTETDWLAHKMVRVEKLDSETEQRDEGRLAPGYAALMEVYSGDDQVTDVVWIGTEAYTLGEMLPETWRPELPERTVLDGDGLTVAVQPSDVTLRESERMHLVIAREEEQTFMVADVTRADLLSLFLFSLESETRDEVLSALGVHAEDGNASAEFVALVEAVEA